MNAGFPWFGPKTGPGWGWTPITWQGWTLTALSIAAVLAAYYGPPFRHRAVAIVAMLVVYLAVVVVTGTKPGGSWK